VKVILERVWNEPAVAIGLLASVALLALNLATGEHLDAVAIITIAGPFLSALGIRQAVTPAQPAGTAGAAGTTYQRPPPP
jgi:hypothetical protein